MNKRDKVFFWVIISVVVLGMLTRLFGLPSNVSPMLVVILLGAAYIRSKNLAVVLPLGLFLLVDLYLNNVVYAEFFDGFQLLGDPGVLCSLVIILPLSIFMLRKVSFARVLISSFTACILFYLISNFYSMLVLPQYTKNFAGLMESYTAAIPFFRSTLVSTMIYAAVFFTSAELYLRRPSLEASSNTETIKA